MLSSWFTTGWGIISFILWLIVLITGRMPGAIFEATSAVLRVEMRVSVYAYLLTPTYLKGVFGDKQAAPSGPTYTGNSMTGGAQVGGPEPAQSPTRPLVLSNGGRTLLIVMLVVGILGSLAQTSAGWGNDDDDDMDAISSSQLARRVAIDFTDDTGHTPQDVHCPNSLDAYIGATEVCTVTDDGVEFRALVTVDAITDGAAHFRTSIEH